MSRIKVSEAERKTPCAVSLNERQRKAFKAMGGSPWLQNLLDREAAFMEAGRKALPQFDPAFQPVGSAGRRAYIQEQDRQNRDATIRMDALSKWPAAMKKIIDGEPSAAPAKKKTAKEQVLAVYPRACCQRSPATGNWTVYRDKPGASFLREELGHGSTTNFAWIHARMKINEAKPAKKARKA